MKKMIIGLLTVGSLSSFAGELINRHSNERIVFELIQNDIQVSFVARDGSLESFIIKSEKLSANFLKAAEILKEERITYKGTKILVEDAKNGTGDGVDKVMTYVMLPFVTSLETMYSPATYAYDSVEKATYKIDTGKLPSGNKGLYEKNYYWSHCSKIKKNQLFVIGKSNLVNIVVSKK